MHVMLAAHFSKGYIAHPYWPEQEKLINIQKESGMRRVRGSDRAAKALADWLSSHNMTADDYKKLGELAARPFYTGKDGEILVEAHQLYGMLAQGCTVATSSIRIARAEQVRSILTVESWRTGRFRADGIWDRFVRPGGGGGGKVLSNQRTLRSNPYIADFDVTGELTFSADVVKADAVRRFLDFCGREIGVGASRKMGWGRFEIGDWKEMK